MESTRLTHVDAGGAARMVDVGAKVDSERVAVAQGVVRMAPSTLAAIKAGDAPKGDVLGTARLAGILAAKQTAQLIPLCHTLLLSQVVVELTLDGEIPGVVIAATVRCRGKTGVEMEALTAVSVAALTVYDMAKAMDKGIVIEGIRVLEKRGGKSGDWRVE
jgi:cyclic pyranopterin phosphate synthase